MEIKKCNRCDIELKEDNKVKKENICKPCCNKRSYENKIKKGLIKEKPQLPTTFTYVLDVNNEVLKCRKCQCDLTDINKVKKEIICKECKKILRRERTLRQKNNEPPLKKVLDKCSICNVNFTEDNRIKRYTFCKSCRLEKTRTHAEEKAEEFKNNPDMFDICCSKCSVKLTPENRVKNRPQCRPCCNIKKREYKRNNKELIAEKSKEYYESNKDLIKEYYKEHYKNHKDTYMDNNRKWRNANRDLINEHARNKSANDYNYRIKKSLRVRIYISIKKNKPTFEYVGCDLEFLKAWLKSLFTEEMTFENYGTYWHIDHVIPCSKFNLEKENDIFNCFRWTNLQPLEANKNLSKRDNIEVNNIIDHYKKVKVFAKEKNIILPKFNYKKYIEIEI